MVVSAVEALADQLVQLPKTIVVPGNQDTMIVIPDLLDLSRCEVSLNGVNVLHTGVFYGFFLVVPFHDAAGARAKEGVRF